MATETENVPPDACAVSRLEPDACVVSRLGMHSITGDIIEEEDSNDESSVPTPAAARPARKGKIRASLWSRIDWSGSGSNLSFDDHDLARTVSWASSVTGGAGRDGPGAAAPRGGRPGSRGAALALLALLA